MGSGGGEETEGDGERECKTVCVAGSGLKAFHRQGYYTARGKWNIRTRQNSWAPFQRLLSAEKSK